MSVAPGLSPTRVVSNTARGWYKISNLGASVAQLWLYDEIGMWGISAADLCAELRACAATEIELHINSPGGDVFDAHAIYTALRSHPARVTCYVDSIAASAASFIAMAGERVCMRPNGQLMIHDAHGICVGNSGDMAKMGALLDRQSDNIAAIYAAHAGGTSEQWRARMRAETWYSAQEAVKAGLADVVEDFSPTPDAMRNSWDLSIFCYAGRDRAPDPFAATDADVSATLDTTGADAALDAATAAGRATQAPDIDDKRDLVVVDTVCPVHHTDTVSGTWDADVNEKRLPSPMTVATAKKMYAWYDNGRVADGELPKDACVLPHHEVSADGTPGPANLAGVRNALARLSTSDIPESDYEAVRAHLRAHLDDAPQNSTDVAVADTADDLWAAMTAVFTTPSTVDGLLERLREGL